MPIVVCPSCRSRDHLVGVDGADGKLVSCDACGHRWTRDLTPTCGVCGSTDLETGGRLADLGATPAAQTQHRLASDLPQLPLPPTDVGARLAEAIAAATRRRPADRPTAEELTALLG